MIEKLSIAGIAILILFITLTLAGCKSDSDSSDPGLLNNLTSNVISAGTTAEVALQNATPATVSGYVIDDISGAGIAGVKVTIDSYGTAYTDGNGNYQIPNILITDTDGTVPTDRVIKENKNISAAKTDYVTDAYAIEIRNGINITANFRLKK